MRKIIRKNYSNLGQFLTEAIFKRVSSIFGRKLAKSVGRPKFFWYIEAYIATSQTNLIIIKLIFGKKKLCKIKVLTEATSQLKLRK